MRYGSVCSGIEAATSAWHSLGWTPQWFSEIEPFPSAVLAHHYPNVPNFGDMTKFKEWKLDDSTAIDVLVGGTPCQSFSVAGLRKGLDDPRGNLMLTYLAIANKYRPKWLVWENVPGVLSSNGGNDFASLLRGMGELGYGFAYRVLDAQHFGVAQRRRRVFVVGCLGDWRAAAAVLFERHSLSGHPAPSRKARQEIAGAIGARTCRSSGVQDAECGHMIPVYGGSDPDCADIVTSKWAKGSGGPSGNECGLFVTQPIPIHDQATRHAGKHGDKQIGDVVTHPIVLMDQGGSVMNVLEDGTVGTLRRETHGHEPVILQPIALAENTIGRQPENGGNGDGFTVGGPMYTLNATGVHGVAQPIPFDTTQITSPENGSNPQPGDPCHPLTRGGHAPAIVYGLHDQSGVVTEFKEVCHTIAAAYGNGGGNIPMTVQPIPFKETADCLTSAYGTKWNGNASADNGSLFVQHPVAYAFDSLSSNSMKSSNPDSGVNQVDVSKTLDTSRGLDPSCNQGGIGVIVAIPISTQNALGRVNGRDDWPLGIFNDGDPAPTLSKSHGHAVATNIHAFPWQSALDPIGKPSDISGTLIKNQTMAVAYAFEPGIAKREGGESRFVEEMSPTLRSGMGDSQVAVAHCVAPTLTAANNPSRSPQSSEVTNQVAAVHAASMAVRRLTPVECERLQGFPDNHTNIPWRKKPTAPDGPRYKALGNSMAVPVMKWIGERIQMVEDL